MRLGTLTRLNIGHRGSKPHALMMFAAAAAIAATLSAPFTWTVPAAHADPYCELGNLLIPQEVHHVGTYRDATCAAVADIVTTSNSSDCVRAVSNYVISRGYDPYIGKDIALHRC